MRRGRVSSGPREGCLGSGLAAMLKRGMALIRAPFLSTRTPHSLSSLPELPVHLACVCPGTLPSFLLCTPASGPAQGRALCSPASQHAPPLHGSLLCCPCPFVVPGPPPHLPLTALRPSALPSLSGLLLCCRPCPGSLTSWRRPARWARGAALQPPLEEASPTSSPSGWPEHDSEAVLGGCHKLWGGRGCSLTGW